MTTRIAPSTQRPAWKALEAHASKARERQLRTGFAADPTCARRMTIDAVGSHCDYSKNRITDKTVSGPEGIGISNIKPGPTIPRSGRRVPPADSPNDTARTLGPEAAALLTAPDGRRWLLPTVVMEGRKAAEARGE